MSYKRFWHAIANIKLVGCGWENPEEDLGPIPKRPRVAKKTEENDVLSGTETEGSGNQSYSPVPTRSKPPIPTGIELLPGFAETPYSSEGMNWGDGVELSSEVYKLYTRGGKQGIEDVKFFEEMIGTEIITLLLFAPKIRGAAVGCQHVSEILTTCLRSKDFFCHMDVENGIISTGNIMAEKRKELNKYEYLKRFVDGLESKFTAQRLELKMELNTKDLNHWHNTGDYKYHGMLSMLSRTKILWFRDLEKGSSFGISVPHSSYIVLDNDKVIARNKGRIQHRVTGADYSFTLKVDFGGKIAQGEAASTDRQKERAVLVAEEQKAIEARKEARQKERVEAVREMLRAARQKERAVLVAKAQRAAEALEKAKECLESQRGALSDADWQKEKAILEAIAQEEADWQKEKAILEAQIKKYEEETREAQRETELYTRLDMAPLREMISADRQEKLASEVGAIKNSHLLTEEETASEMVKAAKQKQRAILVANAQKLDAALEKADECLKSSEKELEREFEDYFRYVSLLRKKDENGQYPSLSSLVSKQEDVEENTANADGDDESSAGFSQNRKEVDDSSQMPEAKLAAKEKEK